jgi:putative hydrolase of the HAD superfamily
VIVKAVLFDAGNTLLFLDYPRLAPAVARATGVPLTAASLSAQARPAALALERADATDRERASRYLESLFRLAGVPEAQMPVVRDTLLDLHREKHLWGGLLPGTIETLERLRAAGCRLGVVSNSDGRAEEGLEAAGLRRYFEVVIDSQLVGIEKPDPRIFEAALRRMALTAEEAIYVGDIYEVDVVGARRAGMDVLLLDPLGNHTGRDVRIVTRLSEVADLVLQPSRSAVRVSAGPAGPSL